LLSYLRLSRVPSVFRSLTGLEVGEFDSVFERVIGGLPVVSPREKGPAEVVNVPRLFFGLALSKCYKSFIGTDNATHTCSLDNLHKGKHECRTHKVKETGQWTIGEI
jgi:hypothetical protein